MAHKGELDTKKTNVTGVQKVSKARLAALEAISDVRTNKAFVREVMDKTLSRHALSAADRAFATKLAIGVVQTRLTLDEVIYMCVKSPEDIKQNVMDALRLSTYEMIYLEKQPYAAVSQGVDLVGIVQPKAKRLANLVLRRVAKLAPKFPFGDPDTDNKAFGRMYAMPMWLCSLVQHDMGEAGFRYLVASSNGQPPCYVFVNQIKTNMDEMMHLFEEIDAKPEKFGSLKGIELSSCVWIKHPSALQNIRAKRAMKEGKFLIADAASQAIVEMALSDCKNLSNMLELCAGKGNKTIMFQSLAQQKWGKQLDLYALDNLGFKTKILQDRCETYGVNLSGTIRADASNKEALNQALKLEFGGYNPVFSMVFIDAPCSGLGTLRRHPEIKWRITPEKITDLSETDYKILENAANFVDTNGYLAYATCTVTHAENQNVIKRFLESENIKNFIPVKLKTQKSENYYFTTQTIGGLNDTHFVTKFMHK